MTTKPRTDPKPRKGVVHQLSAVLTGAGTAQQQEKPDGKR